MNEWKKRRRLFFVTLLTLLLTRLKVCFPQSDNYSLSLSREGSSSRWNDLRPSFCWHHASSLYGHQQNCNNIYSQTWANDNPCQQRPPFWVRFSICITQVISEQTTTCKQRPAFRVLRWSAVIATVLSVNGLVWKWN